jgi:hypothetical protein
MLLITLMSAAFGQSLSVTGACPGPVSIEATGLTPNAQFALLTGDEGDVGQVPGGPCAGTALDIGSPVQRKIGSTGANGEILLSPDLPGAACGLGIQVLDGANGS